MSDPGWHTEDRRLLMFARNVSSRYTVIALNAMLGLVVVPFNLRYLGEAAYGLWILTASITTYFSVLELGYGSATVKYVAEYRARRDSRALNEIASTTFHLFAALGLAAYALAIGVAFILPHLFNLPPGQERTGQIILLIIAANVAAHFIFGVYGGVVNGFERNYKNFVPGTLANIAAVVANVVVLRLGYGLIELVAVTTAVRLMPYWVYRRNAYRVFPDLEIRWHHVKPERLRELTSFSAYLAVIDWSSRLTYTSALIILGYLLSTAAVTVYAIGEKITQAILQVTNQLHPLLFPAIVHRTVAGNVEAQQELVVRAARLQLAVAIALAGSAAAAAGLLVPAWVERGTTLAGIDQSIQVLQVLALVVVLRTSMAMPTTLLKATGHHKHIASASAGCGVASVLLSIGLVKTVGVVGAAWGMLLPVAVMAVGVVFPLMGRVLQLSVGQLYRRIVWPALWPALPMLVILISARPFLVPRLLVVLPVMACAVVAYAALFLAWGLDRAERLWMRSALASLWRGRPREAVAA